MVHPGIEEEGGEGSESSEICALDSRAVVSPLRAVSPPASAISAPPHELVKMLPLVRLGGAEVRRSSARWCKEGKGLFATLLAVDGARGVRTVGVRTGGELSMRFCALTGRGARM